MKRILLIPLLMWGQGTFAATRCVPFSDTMSCQYTYSAPYKPDSESNCTANGVTFHVRMIGVCGSETVPDTTVADTIQISSDTNENTQCWCKMLSPAVSKWVAYTSDCSGGQCGQNCRLNGSGFNAFRTALFNNLDY